MILKLKRNNFFIILSIILLAFIIIYFNDDYNKRKKSIYKNAYYSIANIDEYVKQTRTRYYEYSYRWMSNIYTGQEKSNGKFNKNDKVLVMFNKKKPSESYLLRNTTVPYKYLDKDTIWTSPPDFINPEDLKFLDE